MSAPLAIWQPAPCPSWCSLADGGHVDWDPIEERRHRSAWATIERPSLDAVAPPDRDEWRLRRTGVRLEQNIRPGNVCAVTVRICTEDDNGRFPVCKCDAGTWPLIVTASEALDLAELVRQAACTAANELLSAEGRSA